jgi:hypothetical protein
MDPITTALVAGLSIVGSEATKSIAKDVYERIKTLIYAKWGDNSPLARAVLNVEANPQSADRAQTLHEEVVAANAMTDDELMSAVQSLVEILKKEGIGGKDLARVDIRISGGVIQGVIGAQKVETENMNFGAPSERKDK